MYTVDYFIKKFEAIPKGLWCMEMTMSGNRMCALGHCGLDANGLSGTEEPESLGILLLNNLRYIMPKEESTIGLSHRVIVTGINDARPRYAMFYPQATPKERILAALYEVKKMQEPKYKDITKELAKFPTEETPDQPIKVILKNVS